jgi:hypothetical protein
VAFFFGAGASGRFFFPFLPFFADFARSSRFFFFATGVRIGRFVNAVQRKRL